MILERRVRIVETPRRWRRNMSLDVIIGCPVRLDVLQNGMCPLHVEILRSCNSITVCSSSPLRFALLMFFMNYA